MSPPGIPRRLLLPCLLGGCFAEPPTVTSGGTSNHHGTDGDPATTSDRTTANGTTVTEGEGTAIVTTSTSDGTPATESWGETEISGATTNPGSSGTDGSRLAPDGSPCREADECAGGACAALDVGEPTVCTARCDPAAGGCAPEDRRGFCLALLTGDYACLGDLDTGTDGDDAGLAVGGESRSGHVAGPDQDVFYPYFSAPGTYPVTITPNDGVHLNVTFYNNGVQFAMESIQQSRTLALNAIKVPPELFPVHLIQLVVSAADGTSGSYSIRMEQPTLAP